MPYMNCNGRTVSRHSTTSEVMKCKRLESLEKQKKYEACTASRECRVERERQEQLDAAAMATVLTLVVSMMIAAAVVTVAAMIDTNKK